MSAHDRTPARHLNRLTALGVIAERARELESYPPTGQAWLAEAQQAAALAGGNPTTPEHRDACMQLAIELAALALLRIEQLGDQTFASGNSLLWVKPGPLDKEPTS